MKVCILAAGRGTRMKSLTSETNKVLLPLNDKSLLTKILSLFPSNSSFVIAIGHEKEKVQEFCQMAHSDLSIDFIQVDPFEGEGSGPGRSLLQCRDSLKEPFYLVCGDTLWDPNWRPSQLDRNFVTVAPVPDEERGRFCIIDSQNGRATKIFDKSEDGPQRPQAFTGLFYIKDFDLFFESLAKPTKIDGEHQLSNGLQGLIEKNLLYVEELTGWIDIGHFDIYEELNQTCPNHIFQKKGAFFYHHDDSVVKFFADSEIIEKRVKRAQTLSPMVPTIKDSSHHFLRYDYIPGNTLDRCLTSEVFFSLINWLDEKLWTSSEESLSPSQAHQFYFDKTIGRIEAYRRRKNLLFSPERVNGHRVLNPEKIADAVSWEFTQRFTATHFHGDLILDNIIVTESNEFRLIDWRESFAENLNSGDLRYDLAKLLMSLEVDLLSIKNKKFLCERSEQNITLHINSSEQSSECIQILKNYCLSKKILFGDIEMIKNLILINIAPLHRNEVAPLFWNMGLLKLTKSMEK